MEQREISIKLLADEHWWGGRVSDGLHMPYAAEHGFQASLGGDLLANQACPLLLSNQGRYVWSEEPFDFSIQDRVLHVKNDSGAEIYCSDRHADLRGAYLAASKNHFPSSGEMPERLLFTAPQYNLWIELLYSPTQEKVLQYARDVLEHGMPAGVIMIDDNWHEPYGTWEFHSGRFPDPRGMVDELHRMGFKVMLWVCPFVSPDSLTFRQLEPTGLLLKDHSGQTAIRKWWNGYSAVLDCTHPGAVDWIHRKLRELQVRYGIDGFKFDAGDPNFYEESDRSAVPNHPNGHCEAWAKVGLPYALNEFRACWKLAGTPLVQRLKDKKHSWEGDGLGALIPDALAQGLLGYSFVCPDMIGGGEYIQFTSVANNLDAELFVRYAQCSALFPMMQFSAAPWRVLDREHLGYCVEAANLHAKLGPEIVEIAEHSARTGEPMVRHLAYEFSGQGYESISDQFLLGSRLMAAPILNKGQRSRIVFIPPGEWSGDDGAIIAGPAIIEIEVPLSRLPWYRRVD
ncbi:glycoside hydrolase family 31 protein [Paenibacillus koleovorans]|uniref:glycoside hydrolase family 31 protein n=1 Tax=Paenibacillus koleovorans TaxID=121608 RepID=UPI000FD7A227|nr:glycoside hydrolase family 31 protein [Paenibacillus koleovorans]